MKHCKYFTLIELGCLFVVVPIVVFVVGSILQTLEANRSGAKHRQAQCTDNLSQIGRAFFHYAMSWDDWYPTTMSGLPENEGKWVKDAKALDLLRSQDLLTDPKVYMCPSLYTDGIEQAKNNTPLTPKNVGYVWNEGLTTGYAATMSGICSDGLTNHKSSGRFVRGDGSVANAAGYKWFKEMKTKEDMMLTLP